MSAPVREPRDAERPAKLEAYRAADYAADYDQRWSGRTGRRRDQRKARAIRASWQSLAEAAGESPRSVLDLPCGTGRFTTRLHGLAPLVCSADLAPAMLAEARAKHPDARYLAADAARLPFRNDTFDAVLCIRFLHLVRDPELRIRFLREFARVARLGVIVDYRHGRTLRIWGRRLRHRLGLLDRAPANPSPPAILRELDAAGLRVIARHRTHFAPLLSDKLLHVAVPDSRA